MSKLINWVKARLGTRYPVLLRGVDGAVTTFLLAFATTFVASGGFDVHTIVTLSVWQKAALAGIAAVLSLAKSTIMVLVTGQTALLGLFSRQVRADRERPPVKHPVPVLKNAKPRPRKTAAKASPVTAPAKTASPHRGAHHAPESGSK